jgi:RHS repeat-associated protein
VALAYDRRDKVVTAGGDAMTYDGFGHVTDVDFNTTGTDGRYTLDALGNRSWSRDDRGHLAVAEVAYQYEPNTGRVAREANPLHAPDQGDTTWTSYDGLGSLYYSLRAKVTDYLTTLRWTVANYHDGANRLLSHAMTYDTVANSHGTPAYTSNESYRYDALGRRVWTQAVRDTGCALVNGTCVRNCSVFEPETGCLSPITRIVWDGDQILYELRADGGPFASPATQEDDAATGALYGRVEYTHGLGIDTPLGVIKGATQVLPWTDWRGRIDQGTCPIQTCSSAQVTFPQRSVYGASGYVTQPPPNWYGTLLDGQRDGSGYVYQRNRYLDPSTGRFTQEDPIGLAGGLNLYGYTNSDPVNFSDPFGLCPRGNWNCILLKAAAEITGGVFGGIGGAAIGFGSGIETGPGVVVTTAVGAAAFGAATAVASGKLVDMAFANSNQGSGDGSSASSPRQKVTAPGKSGAEAAKDVPSWAKGNRPNVGENGKSFAKRLLDEKYGPDWSKAPGSTGPRSEFNMIKKWGDRAFVDPE